MNDWGTARHRTAITRAALSAPARQAILDGVIRPGDQVLDYGSGRGLDVKRLRAAGVAAKGWDPYYAPGIRPAESDHVLLIYVLNVIESAQERRSTLQAAWRLSKRCLVVATRLEWDRRRVHGEAHADGTLTSHGTFQHLYSPRELVGFVQDVTGVRCVAAAPGVVYAFRQEADRLSHLARRLLPETEWQESTTAQEALAEVVRFTERRGRLPVIEEMPSELVELLGRAQVRDLRRLVTQAADPDAVAEGAKRSTLDTLLVLGIELFNGRGRLSDCSPEVQENVHRFFPSYQDATRRADRLLLKLRDDTYVRGAMRNSVGKLTPSALYVHRRATEHMPVVLRLYEYCGAIAAGRPTDYDIVKLTHHRRAVSWLGYPDFDSDPHPRIAWSYSVTFPDFDTQYTHYSDRPNRPLLHRKEEFLAADDSLRDRFKRLTKQEIKAGLYANPSLIGTEDGWERELERCGVQLRGHRLVSRGPSD